MIKNISLEEAQDLLLNHCPLPDDEYCTLTEAWGRVLSTDITAMENIPPFDRSPYDGYTFQAKDTEKATKKNPVTLQVIEEVPAGYMPENKICSGQAIKILTGSPIPEGADSVIRYEETLFQENSVSIFRQVKSGENIIFAGEDVREGDVIAERGTQISPPVMGLLASVGIKEVPVFKRPRIAIVSTGDELLDVGDNIVPGKIRNSNSYTLIGYIRSLGAEPLFIGMAKDKAESVAHLVQKGLEKADMVITTGGVSVGDYDVVAKSLELLGAEILYWKMNIKPGSPTLAAIKDDKLILGLSGNPAAAMIVFQLLGFPYIKKMEGRKIYLHSKLEVELKNDFLKTSPQRRFLRGRLVLEGGKILLDNSRGQGNGVLSSMKGSNLLGEIPAGSGPVKSGEKLMAYFLE